jgi:FADH2 O2-dependent halogenase
MLDRARHPRFAIGESSTPVADLVLGDLCDRYDLPRIKPLTRYGTWRRTYPGIVCGLKRGFSYFHHRPGEPFRQDAEHTTELLVTASGSDDVGDTHWYRADVDAFLAGEACAAGVRLLEEAHLERLEDDGAWALHGTQHGAAFCVRAGFVIDGSGAGGVLPQRLALPDESDSLRTQSRTVYAHVRGLRRWSHVMQDAGQCTADHPYPCDDAALHHIFPGA